ncbi:iron-siderophore ABC transporter substrate-binding protein [Cellulomonas sp. HZM]|uniref:ABC transporter substrate-binding protein n=1 Tax=Cellulomonas sp. HZM TaxID=1454010 RepID=UPI000493AA67|nr:iron-siderophore ABC transporter substrate-binding protein [Cellulomonas sp. HZM]
MTVRRWARAVVAVACCAALAACTSAGAPGSTDASGAGQSATGQNATGTRTVENVDGTPVAVPAEPQRVVTLSEPTTDAVLALGIEPVGVVSGRGQSTVSHYLADRAQGIPLLGGVAQPNYEAIGRAKPDLILVDGTSINNDAESVEMLRRIAPTVYTGYAGGDWRTNFRTVADALGRADEAQTVLDEYDAHAKKVGAELAAAGFDDDTFSIVRWQGTSAALILTELPPGVALTDLGLKRPAGQDVRGRGHAEPVSLENLARIDADYLFLGTLGGSSVDNPAAGGAADDDAARSALLDAEKTPGFTSLAAYRAGHVIPVDGSTWTSTGGPILMNDIVDDVRAALLGS